MAELGSTTEYLYWSARRTARFIEDNGLAAATRQVTRTISSPSLQWLPTLSRSATNSGSLRPQIAAAIERALGQIAVTRFDAPGPIQYAKGASTVVFGEFKTFGVQTEREPALIFTAMDYNRRDRNSVAVCLYGSMDNFPEHVISSGPGFRDGWVSSSAPAIYNFIKSHGEQLDDPYFTPESMAIEALNIADGQGLSSVFTSDETALGVDRAWQRAFTYGEARQAQWLAQIYLDADLTSSDGGCEDNFRRVLIGAPLWIRTPHPQAVSLYADNGRPELVEGKRLRAKSGITRVPAVQPRPSADRLSEPQIIASVDPPTPASSSGAERPTIAVPLRVYGTLLSGFAKGEADWAVQQILKDVSSDNRLWHLGDPFGRVFAWVWSHDKSSAMMLLSDYLGTLAEGHVLAHKIDPPIRLDEVLSGLRPALPAGFSDYDEVVTMARREVRWYYGTDPNNPKLTES